MTDKKGTTRGRIHIGSHLPVMVTFDDHSGEIVHLDYEVGPGGQEFLRGLYCFTGREFDVAGKKVTVTKEMLAAHLFNEYPELVKKYAEIAISLFGEPKGRVTVAGDKTRSFDTIQEALDYTHDRTPYSPSYVFIVGQRQHNGVVK